MKCPHCGFYDTNVIDTRSIKNAFIIRRRRICKSCKKKFTTYERLDDIPLRVIKSDGRREPFSVDKLREGILRAIEKCNIDSTTVEQIINEVQQEISSKYVLEVPSKIIGELVLERLFKINPVAYVRFASVYYQYDSIDKFLKELKRLKRLYKKREKTEKK